LNEPFSTRLKDSAPGHAAGLGAHLEHLHAGDDRVAGEMPGAVLFAPGVAGCDVLGVELQDLVDEA